MLCQSLCQFILNDGDRACTGNDFLHHSQVSVTVARLATPKEVHNISSVEQHQDKQLFLLYHFFHKSIPLVLVISRIELRPGLRRFSRKCHRCSNVYKPGSPVVFQVLPA